MDADRFDTLAKRLVAPTTRRATLGGVAVTGLLSALGLYRAAPEVRAAQANTCALAFVATVRLGPSVEQVLTPGGRRPGELRGELSFALSETGQLESGALLLPDGASLPVVGQATGHSLQVRIELGQRRALVAVGVGEQAVAACQGGIDGVATGPEVGDLGDWHAAVLRQTDGTGRTGSGSAGPGSTGSDGSVSRTSTGRTGPATESAQCAPGLSRCGGVCVDLSGDLNNCGACGEVCESGLVDADCRNGVCERATCPAGTTGCGDVDGCRDLSSDPQHCGACQKPCASGVCAGGVCEPGGGACPAGQTDCGGVCVDLQSDPNNCGGCGNDCGILHCITGFCCPAGSDVCGGVCVDLFADPANCGACGNVCAAGLVCRQRGTCVCPVGLDSCNGVCVDLQTDAANCGACGAPCADNQFCEGGICMGGDQLCAAGLSLCGFGFCVDLQTDPTNCGACGVPCGINPCISGVCIGVVGQLPPLLGCADLGLTSCGGNCVDLQTDEANCGACGYNCGGDPCISGVCTGIVGPPPAGVLLTCAEAGLTSCGGVCVDVLTDANNCGGCGGVCGAGQFCSGATCFRSAPDGIDLGACASQGLTECFGGCVDLSSDAFHCGACGNPCPLGGFCQGGVCIGLICPDGLTDCGIGRCVNLNTDRNHCGHCGGGCFDPWPGDPTCVNGVCNP